MTQDHTYWPVLGALAATTLWGVSAFANFHAGFALSEDRVVQVFLGAASIGADLMKVALLFAMCAAWRLGRPLIAGLSLGLFLVMSVWSLRAGGVFIADALTAHSARLAHARKVEENADVLMQLRQQRAAFLSGQQTERRRLDATASATGRLSVGPTDQARQSDAQGARGRVAGKQARCG